MTLPLLKTQLVKGYEVVVKYNIFCGVMLAGNTLYVMMVAIQMEVVCKKIWLKRFQQVIGMLHNRVTDLSYLRPTAQI